MTIKSVLFLILLSFGDAAFQTPKKSYGRSRLVIYAGKDRHEVDGQTCSVGIAFAQPTVLSCICINGVWAFYGENCSPLSIVGGQNHCFPLPNAQITRINTISNPMRPFGNSLVLFKENMENIQQKVYRNVHLTSTVPLDIITVNSSWTITSLNGDQRFCLNSTKIIASMMDNGGGSRTKDQTFEGVFCTFKNLANFTTDVGEILRGCNDSLPIIEILPTECQPILRQTSENVCSFLEHDWGTVSDFPHDNQLLDWVNGSSSSIVGRSARKSKHAPKGEAKKGGGGGKKKEGKSTPAVTSDKDKLKKKYPNMPAWLRREIDSEPTSKEPESEDKSSSANMTQEEMLRRFDNEWNNVDQFSHPQMTDSNQIITEEIWQYERTVIKNNLKIVSPQDSYAKKTHPTEAMISKLILLSKSIMRQICPMENSGLLDLTVSVFLSLQSKIFDWNDSTFTHLDFKRIEASLTRCLEHATPIPAIVEHNKCQQNDNVHIPRALRSDGFDPVIESVWKIFVSVHSYCYKTFDKFYSDHHKYTTIIIPLFGKQLRPFWLKPKNAVEVDEAHQPYAGLLGNVGQVMAHFDRCTYAARTLSKFPFHLTRPIGSGDAEEANEIIENTTTLDPDSTTETKRRRKREVLNEEGWKKQRRILEGLGYCLKKYNEPKERLHQQCSSI